MSKMYLSLSHLFPFFLDTDYHHNDPFSLPSFKPAIQHLERQFEWETVLLKPGILCRNTLWEFLLVTDKIWKMFNLRLTILLNCCHSLICMQTLSRWWFKREEFFPSWNRYFAPPSDHTTFNDSLSLTLLFSVSLQNVVFLLRHGKSLKLFITCNFWRLTSFPVAVRSFLLQFTSPWKHYSLV